jgi:PTH1 family peptidyl-tRNA hydrolase
LTNLKCIFGLGNPDTQYSGTRHNIGFRVVDELAMHFRSSFKPGEGSYWSALAPHHAGLVLLVKPKTFMNESGEAFLEIMEQEQLSPSQILVVVDDFQLPLGTLRFRERGSDGGHNGLASIIDKLQSDFFHRLRVGIGSSEIPVEDKEERMADYVLSRFTTAEKIIMAGMMPHTRDAVLAWYTKGIRFSMNEYNRSFLSENSI